RHRYQVEYEAYLNSQHYAHWKAISSAHGAGRKKRKKDPNSPKAPLTAYVIFSNAIRQSVQDEFPGINFADAGRIMGERWRQLSPMEKKPYEEAAGGD